MIMQLIFTIFKKNRQKNENDNTGVMEKTLLRIKSHYQEFQFILRIMKADV